MQMFISKDPIEFESGDFNHYRYVGNDPVNFRDPSGLTVAGGPGDAYARELIRHMVDQRLKEKQRIANIKALKKWGPKEATWIDKYGDEAGLCLSIGAILPGPQKIPSAAGAIIIDIEQGDDTGVFLGIAGLLNPVAAAGDLIYAIMQVVK